MIRFIIEVRVFIIRYAYQLCLLGAGTCLILISNNKQKYVEHLSIVRRANLRVPYNPLYKNTECKDWSEDSTITQGKIETLNEILAR